MSQFFTPNLYQKNNQENMYREEVKANWHDIVGSRTEFRLSQYGVRMYISTTMLINQGVVSENIYEYKPMFHLKFYDSQKENQNFNLLLNTANCQFLSVALKILVEDSSIVTFFNKSDTSGWYVKQQYKGVKAMPTKEFSKSAFVEIFPETDDRKLPAYKFRWCKDQQEVICIFTKGEIITLIDRLDGFIDQCPLYVNIFENELLKKKLNAYADQMNIVQNNMFALSEQMNNILKEIKLSKEETKQHFSTSLNSILAVFSSLHQINGSKVEKIQECVSSVVVKEEKTKIEEYEDDTDFILEKSNKAMEFLQEPNVVDTDALPQIDKDPESLYPTAQPQPNGYFNTPAMYVAAAMEENNTFVMNQENMFSTLENKKIETQQTQAEILDIKDLKKEDEEIPIWETDLYLKKLQETFKFEYVNDPSLKGGNRVPVSSIYPDIVKKYITKETEDTTVEMSCLPDSKMEILNNFNLDNVLTQVSNIIEPNKKYSLAHYLLDSKQFTRAYIAGMLINKGRIGIPVSSIVYATSIYATAYELIEKGLDPLKVSNECAMHILNCFVEKPKISKEKHELYEKYFSAIATDLVGHETKEFNKYLFALDKMLVRGAYEFSAFDLKLESLNEMEKCCVGKALTDVYIMLYYAEKEHMSFNAQTSPNFELYFLINKDMYRFVRSMLVNFIRCNRESSIKQSILKIMFDYQKICERLGWETTKYRDALITFFVTNEMSKRHVEPIIDTVEMNTSIPKTNIFRGMPCQEIMEAISKID